MQKPKESDSVNPTPAERGVLTEPKEGKEVSDKNPIGALIEACVKLFRENRGTVTGYTVRVSDLQNVFDAFPAAKEALGEMRLELARHPRALILAEISRLEAPLYNCTPGESLGILKKADRAKAKLVELDNDLAAMEPVPCRECGDLPLFRPVIANGKQHYTPECQCRDLGDYPTLPAAIAAHSKAQEEKT